MIVLAALVLLALNPLAGSATKSKDPIQPRYTIAICEQYGALAFIRDPKGNVIGYRGISWELLQWISEKLKFKYTLVHSGIRLDPFPNGTWGGIVGLLQTKVPIRDVLSRRVYLHNTKIDIAFAGLLMAPNLFQVADLTATVIEEPVVVLLPVPVEENRALATIKPFSLQVWLLFWMTVLFITLSLFVLKRFKQYLTKSTDTTVHLQDLAMSNLQLVTGQGGFDGHSFRPLAQRLTLAGWILSALILVNVYTSSYIAYATAPRLLPLAETLQDLAYRSDLQPLSLILLQNSKYVDQAGDAAMRVLGERMRRNPDSILSSGTEVVHRISRGCCFILYPKVLLELTLYNDLKQTGRCRCSISKTPIMWEYYAIGTLKGSAITTELSKQILYAKEFGLVQYWLKTTILKRPYKCLTPEPSKIRPLMMKDLSGAFIILVAGILLSSLAFTTEVLAAKIARRKTAKLIGVAR